jgi:hypothetical protein
MLIGNEVHPQVLKAMDGVETLNNSHQGRYVKLSHKMPDETAEASARALIRTVPMVYGVLLGLVLSNWPVGIAMGSVLTIALDMRMGRHSFFLPLLGPLLAPLCPLVDGIAHGLAWVIRSVGLRAPSFLANMHCGVPRR